VTPTIVNDKLLKLNTQKSPGEDQIHPKVLKESAETLCEYLACLFSKSLATGRLPNDWKSAIVVPLHKKGSKKKTENYRPVSLTSIICKLFESIVRDHIVSHMNRHSLFIEHQHGFRAQRSCVTQLLEVVDEWSNVLDEGGCIDTIYLDFQKAFDTVPHERLINKMYSYGIRGNVLKWTKNFLSNRKQAVRIGKSTSSRGDVISGIPQGSVLGPILFLIFINDLPEVVHSSVKLFADDTKLYRRIESETDCVRLQEDLDSLANWSEKWLLRFNPIKCKSMHLGRQNLNHEYHMNSGENTVKIQQTNQEKDLGVIFDENMKFNLHISSIVKKANQKLGMIRRSFEYMDKQMFLMIYKTLIRPTLEYATVIWSPWMKKDIVSIEQVQRRATKLVKEIRHLTYEQRLKELGLPTLVYRRQRADMVQMFKILNKADEVHLRSLSVSSSNKTRGHNMKLEKHHYKHRSAMNTFTARSANDWNILPSECVNSNTVNSFKSSINTVWKNKPVKFQYEF